LNKKKENKETHLNICWGPFGAHLRLEQSLVEPFVYKTGLGFEFRKKLSSLPGTTFCRFTLTKFSNIKAQQIKETKRERTKTQSIQEKAALEIEILIKTISEVVWVVM